MTFVLSYKQSTYTKINKALTTPNDYHCPGKLIPYLGRRIYKAGLWGVSRYGHSSGLRKKKDEPVPASDDCLGAPAPTLKWMAALHRVSFWPRKEGKQKDTRKESHGEKDGKRDTC
ncbi:hypothetical protein E2C01_091179 [Portunus trituberculatus]|uniref:Uncharacterized protein n=1 Tax=Portunus trituberculatus TaxID=210409 RepID=A0A5B7JMA9_PORTR|nr:hypothetical protein [Portunus trituberculatus]